MATKISLKRPMKIIALLTVILMSTLTTSLPAQTKQESEKKQDFGEERDAGDRGSCEVTKPNDVVTNESLTALIPIKGKVNAAINQPTLWFYIPFSSASKLSAELILQNKQGKEVARSASISLPNKPGILSVRLPKPLTQNTPNRFFFSVSCDVSGSRRTLEVSGSINWVKPNATLLTQLKQSQSLEQTVNLYVQAGYWSDTLSLLATQRDKNAQAAKLWTELLQTEKLEKIAPKPILPCCNNR